MPRYTLRDAQAAGPAPGTYGDERDYPFDPRLPWGELRYCATQLDRLRWHNDRKMAAQLYRMQALAEANEGDPEVRAAVRKEAQEEDERKLRQLASAALSGRLGPEAKIIANRLLPIEKRTGKRQVDPMMLRDLRKQLRQGRHGDDELYEGIGDGLGPAPTPPPTDEDGFQQSLGGDTPF